MHRPIVGQTSQRPQLFRCAAVMLLALAAPAAAQQPSPSAPPAATTPAFVIQSDNGDNRLQLGGLVHVDGRFAVDDPQHTVTDTFLVRRLRAVAQGRVARYFDFYVNIDFANAAVNIRDAYFDTHFADAFRVRMGKSKVPVSYERLIPVANLLFVERSFTTGVAPDRDTGVQVLGDLAGTAVSYVAALTNGVIDGGSAESDTNDSKGVAGRLVIRPWIRNPRHPLAGFGVGLAADTFEQGGALPSFQSSARQTYFSYAGAAGVGRRTRWAPQAFYYHGPFGAYGEFVHSSGDIQKSNVRASIDHDAWVIVASWVLTGEAAGERNVRPKVSFDPPSHHYGAWQIAARYHTLTVSRDAVTLGFAAAAASRTAQAWTLGLNWYLNSYVKWNVNVERTVFDHNAPGARHAEDALLVQAHLGL